ncbi:polysaccharide chain length determinant protein (PEP-CTERM system associated) [Duganella sp. SG902]|uniref:XrtA system polysaccharide chain length determinant n=1 Tax=Duganella sp. SG902 TaxID=2587016 RepID=UPI00159DBE7C|nr:XrtA system polysaccharide chain length determinant [Duganella sp. SG902]NVM78346.1 polysaccharide chain length determinant protein (PEP-CTERM system associated) [Duganella sp. SG902]
MEELISQLISSLKGIWKYRWYAISVAWLVAIAGWVKVTLLPDDYQTSARVFVDTQSILKPLLAGMTSVPNIEQQVAIMSRTLLSRPNVERVLRMVDLDINARTAREQQQQLEELMSKIRISSGGNDIYTITYNHRNPRMVREVVQSLLTIFVESSFKGKSGETRKAVQFIDDQIKVYEDKLTAAENSVKEFRLKNNGLLPRQGVDYSSQLMQSSDALNAARLELAEAEQARKAISNQITGDEPILGADLNPASIDNPELDGRISALNKSLDALRMQYTELHPDIIAAKRLVAQLEARKVEESKLKQSSDPGRNYSPMLQQLKVAQTEAEARVAAIQARVQEFTLRHQRLLAQANAVPEVETELAQLNRDYQVNKDNYEKLIGRREAAKLSGDLSSTTDMMTFKIIDPPTVPYMPIGPNRVLLYTVTLGAALLMGVAAALLISQVRPTFLSPAELRDRTGFNVLGTVSMNWTDSEKRKRRRGKYLFGAALSGLFLAYGAVLAANFLRY